MPWQPRGETGRRRTAPLILLLALLGSGAAMADPPPHAHAFAQAFEAGWSVRYDSASPGEAPRLETLGFAVEDLGRVTILSGRICAADPFLLNYARPFSQPVPNGDFAVQLATLNGATAELGNGRVVFARALFSSSPIVRWSLAHAEGLDPATLKPGEIVGYAVDTGTGSFFDPAARAIGAEFTDELVQSWIAEGEANGKATPRGFGFRLVKRVAGVNILMFDSGWGDGVYASWFGFDASGNVAALVTDFQTIDWAKVSDASLH
jgi:hypothetical protein